MIRVTILIALMSLSGNAGAQELTTEQLSALVQSYRAQLTSAVDQIAQLNAQLILNNKMISDLQQQLSEARKNKSSEDVDKK